MQIVVTGHGNFATGIASTVQLLAGNVSGVQYVDFTADMNEETLTNKLQETLTQDQGTVFFCDLLGGTPYKQAATLKATGYRGSLWLQCSFLIGKCINGIGSICQLP